MAAEGTPALIPLPDDLRLLERPLLKYTHHLFVSYADGDSAIAASLEDQLESIGFKIFRLDDSHFTKDIDKCQKLITFITPNYLGDNLQKFQMVNFLKSQIDEGRRQYIPIIHNIGEALVPSFMKEVNYIKTSEELFWKKLVRALTEKDVPLTANVETEDIADGLAWGYYYGFLALILPGIQQRLDQYKFPNPNIPCFKKLIILMPESGFCAKSIGQVDSNFKFVEYAKFNVTRSANNNRDYGNTLWKMVDSDSSECYVALEYATPMWTMYEMEMGRIAGLSPEAKAKELMQFRKKLREILEHEQSQACHGKYVLLDWFNDRDQSDPHALSRLVVQTMRKQASMDVQ